MTDPNVRAALIELVLDAREPVAALGGVVSMLLGAPERGHLDTVEVNEMRALLQVIQCDMRSRLDRISVALRDEGGRR